MAIKEGATAPPSQGVLPLKGLFDLPTGWEHLLWKRFGITCLYKKRERQTRWGGTRLSLACQATLFQAGQTYLWQSMTNKNHSEASTFWPLTWQTSHIVWLGEKIGFKKSFSFYLLLFLPPCCLPAAGMLHKFCPQIRTRWPATRTAACDIHRQQAAIAPG